MRCAARASLLTHDHADHSEAAPALAARLGVRSVAAAGDGDTVGPFDVLAVPGHADDHLVFVAGRDAFTGDAVLGEGSVFVSGRLREYLDGLRRLRALDLERIHPGHGDEVDDPNAKLDEYLAHRLDRERKLLAALEAGARERGRAARRGLGGRPAAVRGRSPRSRCARTWRSCAKRAGSRRNEGISAASASAARRTRR